MQDDGDPSEPPNHLLHVDQLNDLAAGRGCAATVKDLWRAQRSRRLLLLRALLEAVGESPALMGPLRSPELVWSVIDRDARKSKRLEDILLHPQVGSWLAHCHRRLRTGAKSDVPLWVHVGQLHALALAVALTGNDCPYNGRVPLWRGCVMLPSVGLVRFDDPAPFGFAEVECANGRAQLWTSKDKITIPNENSSSWWPLRTVEVEADCEVGGKVESRRLKVWLDDIDPFRGDAGPVPPDRLDDQELVRWGELASDAWQLLCADDPEGAAAIAEGVRALVPIADEPSWGTRSASSGDAFGSVMMSRPPDATTMAVTIVHEFQHIKLDGVIHLMPLFTRETQGHYAPWREDPRPLGGFFQGVYAFIGIAAFWRKRRLALSGGERENATIEYILARRQTERALAELSNSEVLTDHGRAFVQGMADRVRSWQTDHVSGVPAELANMVIDAHRAGWRIRHSRPSAATVNALVRSWFTQTLVQVVPGEADIEEGDVTGWSLARLGLARRMVSDGPNSVHTLDEIADREWSGAATQADIDLLRGDRAAAQAGFARAILADPADCDAWTGLGLALARDSRVGGATLLDYLGLVRRVYLEVVECSTGRPYPASFVEAMVARLMDPA